MSAPQEVLHERAALSRDFVFKRCPVEGDSAAVRLCLKNDDDAGAATTSNVLSNA